MIKQLSKFGMLFNEAFHLYFCTSVVWLVLCILYFCESQYLELSEWVFKSGTMD